MTNYISTENTQRDEDTTKLIVDEMQILGWDVEYGDAVTWAFEDDHQRLAFENDLSAIMEQFS